MKYADQVQYTRETLYFQECLFRELNMHSP
jgi:hypothetical protein